MYARIEGPDGRAIDGGHGSERDRLLGRPSDQGLAQTGEGFPRGLAVVLDFLGSPLYLLHRPPLFIHDAPSRGDTRDERGEGGNVVRDGWTAFSHAATVAPRMRAAKVGQAGYDFRSRHGAV